MEPFGKFSLCFVCAETRVIESELNFCPDAKVTRKAVLRLIFLNSNRSN